MGPKAKLYFDCVVGIGALVFIDAISAFDSQNLPRFLTYLALAILSALCKLRVPGIHATLSPAFVFVLLAIANSSLGEVVTIGCSATLVQSLWLTRSRPRPSETVFSVAAVAIAVLIAYSPAHTVLVGQLGWSTGILALAAAVFIAVNTGLVGGIVALVSDRPFIEVWRKLTGELIGSYFVWAILGVLMAVCDRLWGWKSGLLPLPLVVSSAFFFRSRFARRAETGNPIGRRRTMSMRDARGGGPTRSSL